MAYLMTKGTPLPKSYEPQLYAPRVLDNYYDNSVLAAVFNTDYQGQFSRCGDSIRIRRNATIDIRPWHDGDKIEYKSIATDDVEMKIDHGVIWSFKVSKLFMRQTDIKGFVNMWTADASKQVQKYTEVTCLGKLLADDLAPGNYGANAGVDSEAYNLGTLTAPVAITNDKTDTSATNASDYIANMMSVLSEQNVTNDGESVSFLCPKIYLNVLQKSEWRAADAVGNANTSLHRGKKAVTNVMGANVYETSYLRPVRNTSGAIVFPIIACTKRAASFALQFTDIWSDTLESEVAIGHRGLAVFGSKLVEPKALTVGYVKFS